MTMTKASASPLGIVMIIDDIPDNLALLSDTLSESGYRVLVATDGRSALEQIEYLRPDIILLDVMMPGINGYETCNRLKANPKTATIPVLFMTALSELNDLLRGFGEGAMDYMVKPIRPPEVLARVEAQLVQARTIQRAENALNNGPYSALTINANGIITWLPVAAAHWLNDFLLANLLRDEIKVRGLLPTSMLAWLKAQLGKPDGGGFMPFESVKGEFHFSAKLIPCSHNDEYLLLLEKHSGHWNIDSVKHSLGLTSREAEILMWISRGKTNKEIGMILGGSPRTVNKHLEHIFEKLGVVTRAAAVSIVMQRTGNLSLLSEENAD
jgi:CheY-like chemotaxis protein/DNA-binding CsgD family transcriptional regulator